MRSAFIAAICCLAIQGCSFLPMETWGSKDGKSFHYYTSANFCGYFVDEERGFGVFASEKGVSPRGGHFQAWIYNLSDRQRQFGPVSVKYYKLPYSKPKTVEVSPGGVKKIYGELFIFDRPGDFYQVSFDIPFDGKMYTGRLTMEREVDDHYWQTVFACGAPKNAEQFTKRANHSLQARLP